jgi:hypothetical protein
MTYRQDYETLFHVLILSKHHHTDQVEGGFDVSSEDALRAALEKAG